MDGRRSRSSQTAFDDGHLVHFDAQRRVSIASGPSVHRIRAELRPDPERCPKRSPVDRLRCDGRGKRLEMAGNYGPGRKRCCETDCLAVAAVMRQPVLAPQLAITGKTLQIRLENRANAAFAVCSLSNYPDPPRRCQLQIHFPAFLQNRGRDAQNRGPGGADQAVGCEKTGGMLRMPLPSGTTGYWGVADLGQSAPAAGVGLRDRAGPGGVVQPAGPGLVPDLEYRGRLRKGMLAPDGDPADLQALLRRSLQRPSMPQVDGLTLRMRRLVSGGSAGLTAMGILFRRSVSDRSRRSCGRAS